MDESSAMHGGQILNKNYEFYKLLNKYLRKVNMIKNIVS